MELNHLLNLTLCQILQYTKLEIKSMYTFNQWIKEVENFLGHELSQEELNVYFEEYFSAIES